MVLPIIIGIAVIGLIITFRDQIKTFVNDLQKESTPAEVDRQQVIDERGALANTRAFIFGEGIFKEAEENKIKVDQFIKDAQTNIDLGLQGVNTSLVEAQQNLEKFAQESQANIVKTVDDSSKAFNESLSGAQDNITKFFSDSALNIQNFFGGQSMPKAIATTIPTNPPLTTKSGTPVIDLSFLTSVEPISGQGSKVTEEELEVKAISSRATRFS